MRINRIFSLSVLLSLILISCKLEDDTTSVNPNEIIRLTFDKDTIDPLVDDQVFITVSLINVSGEHDVEIKTDYGFLSEVPFQSSTQQSVEIKSAGEEVKAVLRLDSSLNHEITISASITSSDNIEYKEFSQIFLSAFKPDVITLALSKDSLTTSESGLITAELSSKFGDVSDNLSISFEVGTLDSSTATLTPSTAFSNEGFAFTSIKNSNNKIGRVYVIGSYNDVVSDSLFIKFY